ncbi:MAG: hypothetical protein FWH16_05590 [Oscillospiraceae bacterium]|nr:hypothetical protein [Oscillospiraceae bacterium]
MKYSAIPMPDLKSGRALIKIDRFLGCDYRAGSLLDDIRRSPDALNMDFGEEMHTVVKRTGFTPLINTALNGRVNGFHRLKTDGAEHRLIHAGTTLYHLTSGEPAVIYTGMADAPSSSFAFGDKLYILDGKAYLEFDGLSAAEASDTAYVPVTAAGGLAHERPNLLTGARRNIFYGNGSARMFYLDSRNIDGLAAHAYIGGTLTPEGSGLTVNRAAGSVEFANTPQNGAEIEVWFSKTDESKAALINKCRYFSFESDGGAAIWLYGNPDAPQTAHLSKPPDPRYFPDGESVFFSSEDDCIAPRSVCRFGGERLSLTPRGLCAETAPISGGANRSMLINRLLTAENGLEDAVSVVIKHKLYLFINSSVYVADSRFGLNGGQYEWHRWTGVPATAAAAWDSQLIFGTADGGVYRFMTAADGNDIYSDLDRPVRAYWTTPFLGTPVTGGREWTRRKNAASAAVTLQPFLRSGAEIYAAAEDEGYRLIKSVNTGLLDFSGIDFGGFIFDCIDRPRTVTVKNAARRFESLRLMIKNDSPEGLGLIAAEIGITAGAEVKGV